MREEQGIVETSGFKRYLKAIATTMAVLSMAVLLPSCSLRLPWVGHSYSASEVDSAMDGCKSKADDLSKFQKRTKSGHIEMTSWFNDLDSKKQGIESSVFVCTFNVLKIPNGMRDEIAKKSSKVRTAVFENLHIAWFGDVSQLDVEFSVDSIPARSGSYYASSLIQHAYDYCQSEVTEGTSFVKKGDSLGIDFILDGEYQGSVSDNSAFVCAVRALNIRSSVVDRIDEIGPMQWNVREGDLYLGWIRDASGIVFTASAEQLKE